jgi:DNA-directed RNA polymerase subunit RPC12/RpoP
MRVRCQRCATEYTLPARTAARDYACGECAHPVLVPVPSATKSPVLPVSGALGGAALGGALAGPPGAIVGGFIGLLIGSAAREQ